MEKFTDVFAEITRPLTKIACAMFIAFLIGGIHQRFNVEYKQLPAIKSMDLSMLATEKEQLLPPASVEWPQLDGISPANITIVFWQPHQAESAYLDQFKHLTEILNYGDK